ncbi:glycosyltransferase family 4 protein [uncultured Kushneria sp.]|uniref:glycosyltransferase family 4 protein n=1 Tax=uncultured Kushneria sp. TaxID=905033 RepID=UPI002622D004|nr:glycosyltransferase family 4 protein [uncultured Kushneria sp.]
MKYDVIMVGPFPPPVHGMASINLCVYNDLTQKGKQVKCLNTSARDLKRNYFSRLARLPRVIATFFLFIINVGQCKNLYSSVSGGKGQVYEVLFIAVARAFKKRIYLHHHTFSYLDNYSRLTMLMTKVAGPEARHIVLSEEMAQKMRDKYGAKRVIAVSNSAFLVNNESATIKKEPNSDLMSIGFMSNIAKEKGIFEFLDFFIEANKKGLPIKGEIAGPFQDDEVKSVVLERLKKLPNVEYLGPRYGAEKELFYNGIDVLLFPTIYANEAEPLTIHEAMSHGLPVIAYGRGAIPEILGKESGVVIDVHQPFVSIALTHIEEWTKTPVLFNRLSCNARDTFGRCRSSNISIWNEISSQDFA